MVILHRAGMERGKFKRRALFALAVVCAALMVLVVGLPLWFPWILPLIARTAGFSYKSSAREGYSRFSTYGVVWSNTATILSAEKVETFFPISWLWNLKTPAPYQTPSYVVVSNWNLTLLPTKNAASNEESTYATAQEVLETAVPLERWLPKALLLNGRISAGDLRLQLPKANWE